jgi:NADPH-ferrihemoprotein reductase
MDKETGSTELICAFSRETGDKVYVHHLLRDDVEQRKRLYRMITTKEGGYLYLCGDAKNMARDVHRLLMDVILEFNESVQSDDEASMVLKKMKDEGRYLEDVWS